MPEVGIGADGEHPRNQRFVAGSVVLSAFELAARSRNNMN
jgi:hypothetical protein